MKAMTGSKLVILVLVVVAVTFAVLVAVGSWPGRATEFDQDSGWVEALRVAFPPKALDQKRIASTCFRDGVFTIPANQPQCEVHIRKGKASIRELKLQLRTGQAELSYAPSPEDKNTLPIKNRKLEPGKLMKLQISKKGGKLTFTNVGFPSQACRIEISK